jgi:hypothetical protein
MERIAELIKVLAVDAVEAQKPSTVLLGFAESDDVIMVEQRLRLSKRSLDFMRGTAFQQGDKVVLLRVHGGQQFVVLGVME